MTETQYPKPVIISLPPAFSVKINLADSECWVYSKTSHLHTVIHRRRGISLKLAYNQLACIGLTYEDMGRCLCIIASHLPAVAASMLGVELGRLSE